MLVSLSVKNFAIIDNVQIEFEPNMTVMTGETGAGKSLIIDALSLLFGARASSDLIRYGENKASIVGVFSNYSKDIINILNELGVDFDEEDNLIIKRELYANGKSVCKINSDIVTLNDLKAICDYVGDIHSQNDSLGLINPKNYLSFIRNTKIDDLINKYQNLLKEYKNIKSLYNSKLKHNEEIKEKMDFLKYQYKELKSFNLNVTEEEDLKNELSSLSNYENINEAIKSFKDIYDKQNALDLIYESLNYLNKLKSYDNKYEDLYKELEDAYYNIEAVVDSSLFKNISDSYDVDKRIDEINSRLGIYSDLKRKYKKTTSEIIEYLNQIEKDLQDFDNFDVDIEDLKKQYQEKYDETLNVAYQIREERIKLSKELEAKLLSNLFDLELKNTSFNILFNDINDNNIVFNKDGIDNVDFMVSFNKGELMKPLSKVASGGELSRFMLALKVVLGDNLPMQTKVFDEVDSGVSGNVAYAIAKKIKEISKTSQVICVTHLPQVASIGDNHLKIAKCVENDRTYTIIDTLDEGNKVLEIASMLSNGNVSHASINMAKELILESKN